MTFNDHIAARILRDRDPRLKILCDKIAVREFIRERVGCGFVVPLLGVWKDVGEIDWDQLPARFVMKPNNASGPIALVGVAVERDPRRLALLARQWLSSDYSDDSLEWGYRGIAPKLLVEPLLQAPQGGAPVELHAFTFGGQVALVRVLEARKFSSDRRDNWFNAEGERLALRQDLPPGHFIPPTDLIKNIVAAAEKLANGFVHLRVDFMLTADGLLVNELTPYHFAGVARWKPQAWDECLGRLWTDAAAGRHGPIQLHPGLFE